jgi:hypothetical protein
MSLASLVLLPFFYQEVKTRTFSKNWWFAPVLGGIFAALDHAT